MAQLLIKYKSQDYAELELDNQQEYLIGRSQDADIPLEGDHSLSRKHSKLYYENETWIIKKISVSGQLFYNDEKVEEQALEDNSCFNIGDFSFVFQSEELAEETPSTEGEGANEAAEEVDADEEVLPELENLDEEENNEAVLITDNPEGNDLGLPEEVGIAESKNEDATSEYTAIIKTNLTVQLNIYKPGQTLPESVNLTKNSWVIGRAKDCDTSVDYVKLSRYHFEITKESSSYWVTDLGSSNGTKLNGVKLKKNESQKLKHDDNIEVKKLKIIFEIINEDFKNFQLAPINNNASLEVNNKPIGLLSYLPASKKKRQLSIGVSLIVILLFFFSLEDKKPQDKNTTKAKQLKPEQIQLLKDNLRLAQTHYTSGKYQLCNAAISKIHLSISSYKNSKELEQYCKQAYQLRQEQEEKRRQVKETEEINNKIIAIIQKCKQGFTTKTLSTLEVSSCLYPAIEINPNHPGIADLKALVESRKTQLEGIVASKAKNNQSYKKGLFKYQKALRLYNKNQLRNSIKAFQHFLNSPHYGMQSLKVKARKTLQKAKNRFSTIINSSLTKCKKSFNSKEYKKAVLFCRKVLQQDPENTETTSLLEVILQKSYKELKEIYKDSVFEESVGSVELAKQMWKKMLKKGIPNEEYYEKAKRKLQKYEGL